MRSTSIQADLIKNRDAITKSKDEIYAAASESGKKLMEVFIVAFAKLNAYQDETVRLAKTDKPKALDRSMHDGRKVVADAIEAADVYIKIVKKNMAEQAEQSKQDGARAEMLLMSLVIASLPDRRGRGDLDCAEHQPCARAGGGPR